jgi:hypothetical protein
LWAVDLFLERKGAELTSSFDSVQRSALVQDAQYRSARVWELSGQLSGRKPGGTASDQRRDRRRETALLGKALAPIVPEALAMELRGGSEGVPLAVMGVAPEVTDWVEESAHGDERVVQGLSQLGEPPAFAAMEELFQAVGGWGWRRQSANDLVISVGHNT